MERNDRGIISSSKLKCLGPTTSRKKKNESSLHFFFATFFLQKADLAVADLTITYEREQGVDFTMPFMNLGTYLNVLGS